MDEEFQELKFQEEIGEEPPQVSIGGLINSFRTRGINATLNDENIGPHSHLLLLLSLVFLISIIIGIYIAVT
jgi:hypothetical protein